MATINLVIAGINKASGPLQDVAASAGRAADRIDALNDRIDRTDRAMASLETAGRLAEAGMKAAGREADILAVKLSVLNDRLDDLDRTVTAKVKLDIDRSALSRLGGLSGGGGAGGGLSGLLSVLPGPLSNPYAAGGAAAAGIAVLPFLAQALAGTGIFALGSGLAGLGIAGALATGTAPKGPAAGQLQAALLRVQAAQQRLAALQASGKAKPGQLPATQAGLVSAQGRLTTLQGQASALADFNQTNKLQLQAKAAFANLGSDAQNSLAQVGRSFVPVMLSVFNTADSVLKTLTPVFASAEKTIAGPFKVFGDTLVRSFASPQVKTSVQAVATAFGKLLTALAPGLPGDVNEIATGVTKVANAVAKNPQAFATFVNDLFKIGQVALSVIADLTNVATYIEAHFRPALHDTAVIFDGVRHEVAHVWDDMISSLIRTYGAFWNDTIGSTIRFGHDWEAYFDRYRHETAVIWDGMRGELGRIYNGFWSDTIGATIRFGHNIETQFNSITGSVIGFFRRLPGQAVSALKSLGTDLLNIGKQAIADLLDGLKSGAGSIGGGGVLGWLSGFAHGIIGTFKGILHIHSPSGVFYDAGKSLMQGLANGIADHAHLASSAVGSIGGNVAAWIMQAMRDTGAPVSWLGALERLVSLESGGNPLAVNPVSVMGEHASGLFQTLPSTYSMFATVPGGVFNPVSDAVAAIRYIMSQYGTPFNIPGLLGGTYRGYASGGIIPEPVLGLGLRSGIPYAFGEHGPETVVPGTGRGGPLIHIDEMHVHDEADAALVAQRLSGMIRVASLGGGWRG